MYGLKMSPEVFARTHNVSRETISRLQIYHDLLVKWQKAINLVSPKTLDDIWARHFTDSAQLARHIKSGARVVDLGSGAGFPGMVLAIMRPDLEMILIESDNRKSEFLKNVSRETKTPVTVSNERVEKILGAEDRVPDVITARAFAALPVILGMIPENCRGAELLLLKGKTALDEVAEAAKAFDFECVDMPSCTDGDARILKISFRQD